MTPIPYVPEQHFEQIKSWLQFWDESMTHEALPQTGFIIPERCVGFLYRTDSSLCIMENIVAAPGLDREVRSEAVDAVVTAIIAEAKRLGFKLMMGYTQLDAMVKRSEKFGFVSIPGKFHLVALPL
ncbi:hypothetical protein [Pyxidicoccus xibeiensis]|uniref:hypothetical protein n=1 Tax=Pyxidicoccus xibeiensis TaxID=2906759 RepID=UPI0020A7DCBB|nr:hypothetical protein [Pyxidicoccus xibeiensis]MCP3137343.1 hypothetical protein [Pyxidicoccus xibeiensis]